MENTETLAIREFNKIMPIQQICPNTGTVIQVFSSRLAAAKYITSDILKKPNKNPVAVTGNMEICMRAGWKAYGYYWKIMTEEQYIEKMTKASITPIFASRGGKVTIYSSIQEAANVLGTSRQTLSKKLIRDGLVTISGRLNTYVQKYNTVCQEVKIDKESRMYKNIKTFFERRIRPDSNTFNNFTYIK